MTLASRLLAPLTLALALFAAAPALAMSLDEARAAGYVGERFDGYLGLVDPNAPAEVRALVEDVNTRRRARYTEIAAQRGVPVEAVGQLTATRVINDAPRGTFVMGSDGRWQRR